MSIDIPSTEDFAELTGHRHPGCVSIYVASTWSRTGAARTSIVHDTEAARTALRSAANEALGQLADVDLDRAARDRISAAVAALDRDRDFWLTQARTAAVFVSPELTRTFRLMNELPQHTAVGDRFDVGPLVRATTFAHDGYVLALTEGDVRLVHLTPDATSQRIDLPTLPADAAEALTRTATGGRADRRRADGALGPKVEQRRYCSIVQDAVLEAIGRADVPLVLAASADLDPAYREINTHRGLLERGIDANPSSLSLDDLETRGRAVLEEHFAAELAAWRRDFGTLRSNGRASSQLSDVARAATAGQVDTLLFDLEWNVEGQIDEAGALTVADDPGPATYGLLDEVAVRTLRHGGTVKAVRRADLPDDTPVAATFRFTP